MHKHIQLWSSRKLCAVCTTCLVVFAFSLVGITLAHLPNPSGLCSVVLVGKMAMVNNVKKEMRAISQGFLVCEVHAAR